MKEKRNSAREWTLTSKRRKGCPKCGEGESKKRQKRQAGAYDWATRLHMNFKPSGRVGTGSIRHLRDIRKEAKKCAIHASLVYRGGGAEKKNGEGADCSFSDS